MTIDLRFGDTIEQMKLIPDKSIDAIICDLPYGTTRCKWDGVIPFDKLWGQYERITKDSGAIVLFGSQPFTSALIMSNPKLFKYEWIWEKSKTSNYVHCKYQPLKAHENIIVFSKYPSAQNSGKNNMVYNPQMTQGEPYNKGEVSNSNSILDGGRKKKVVVKSENGERYPRSVKYFKTAETEGQLHSTQKPILLLEMLVKTYSNEGDTILDNTFGSCTTGIACINTNRNFIGIENNMDYFNISLKRVEEKRKEKEFNVVTSFGDGM